MQCGLRNHLKDFNNKQKETQNPFTKKLQPPFFLKKKCTATNGFKLEKLYS